MARFVLIVYALAAFAAAVWMDCDQIWYVPPRLYYARIVNACLVLLLSLGFWPRFLRFVRDGKRINAISDRDQDPRSARCRR